jgi:large subunit ribosomal protein L23
MSAKASTMRTPQSIIKRPLLTEKSARLRETGGAAAAPAEGDDYAQQIVFEVAKDANKIEIASAVTALFKVTVLNVRTIVSRGKLKRVGRFAGRRAGMKKAIVTLKPGDNISFFEGV